MKTLYALLLSFLTISTSHAQPKLAHLTSQQLKDKIMGGWAGQTIGVTFGGPYEFRFLGTFIGDYQPLVWYDGYLEKTMRENPGLYDDLYMDLTFVDVFQRYGLDAPVDSFASAYAHAEYPLWHANQAGRYNILHGMKAPQSGNWIHNPHADCIDYQIESDFAGLMSPAMPNISSSISDKVGHIMNYGDGWYGGVFVSAMYTQSFVSSDISFIIGNALRTIPEKSTFYQCINDVLKWHAEFPTDWKRTWFELQKKWADEVGCPDGVFSPFNIDAKINAAYVVIGLLYGDGDFTRSLNIATRCGQDADCNPSTVGGILGTVLGYNKIPAYWKMGLAPAEKINFKYTNMSLNTVYDISYRHAIANIQKHGGTVHGDNIDIPIEEPVPVKFEQSFPGLYPISKIEPTVSADKREFTFEFDGTGFVMRGEAKGKDQQFIFQSELYIDDQLAENPQFPVNFTTRRHELCWKYQLAPGKHRVRLAITNTAPGCEINAGNIIIYSNKPATP